MSIKTIVYIYIEQIRPHAQAELDWFQQQPTLASALGYAALAINCAGKRYSHQRRIKRATLEQARETLLANVKDIEKSKSFNEIYTLVDTLLEPIDGIGELYVYDTSLRIGAKMNLLPTKVYLHAGARDGARALGFDGKAMSLDISDLPVEFQQLEPHEIEDVLCIFKTDLKKMSVKVAKRDITKRSWCG
jgi:hypothetical protein